MFLHLSVLVGLVVCLECFWCWIGMLGRKKLNYLVDCLIVSTPTCQLWDTFWVAGHELSVLPSMCLLTLLCDPIGPGLWKMVWLPLHYCRLCLLCWTMTLFVFVNVVGPCLSTILSWVCFCGYSQGSCDWDCRNINTFLQFEQRIVASVGLSLDPFLLLRCYFCSCVLVVSLYHRDDGCWERCWLG